SILGRDSLLDFPRDQMTNNFGIRLALELAALREKLIAQRLEILDESIVYQGHRANDVRVCVADRRRAVGRPACVGYAGDAVERVRLKLARQIIELAFRSPPFEPAIIDCADAGRIVAAIFQPLEAVEQPLSDIGLPDDSNNSAHYSAALRVIRSRKRLAQPAIPFCSLRSTARASGSPSRVITDPAPINAPAPMVTGATSAVFEPTNAPSPTPLPSLPKHPH